MTYRLIVTGAREWDRELLLYGVLDEYRDHQGLVLVHGACPRGADHMADRWARLRGVQVEWHPADWQTHGRKAGPIRNKAMVDAGADLCVAFLTASSRGARGTADMAEAAGIPTRRIRSDGRERGGAA